MVLNRKSFLLVLMFLSSSLWAGQNDGAGICFDMASSIPGNQNLTTISCPGADILIRVDVYVLNASNLDNYEININYNSNKLAFISGEEDNPFTSENNILKENGGVTVGFTCTTANGVINCANTLQGNQGGNSPDGVGLLVSLEFRTLVDCPGQLSFGFIEWYDNDRVIDIGLDIGEDLSLPVELYSFTLTPDKQNVKVEWETTSELNNHGYYILRSSPDTLSYIQINKKLIEGRGNTSTESYYKYIDVSAVKGDDNYYKLEQINFGGNRILYGPRQIFFNPPAVFTNTLPMEYTLSQNYPNPFNPTTKIGFGIPEDNYVEIAIYNSIGQLMKLLTNSNYAAGYHMVTWDGRDKYNKNVQSGLYFYNIKAGKFNDAKKMLLIK